MKQLLLVGFGGMIGSMLRYQVGMWLSPNSVPFPLGTITVNILGSLVIGILAAYLIKQPMFSLFLITGFCGGFTTFSAFSLENMNLIQTGQIWTAALYTLLSFSIGLISCFGGYYFFLTLANQETKLTSNTYPEL